MGAVYSCGSSDGSSALGGPGISCSTNSDCVSGNCTNGACAGGFGAPSGTTCTTNTDCASGACNNGTCGTGTMLPDGRSCASPTECASGVCTNGACGGATSSGNPDASSGAGGSNGAGGAPSSNLPGGSVCTANTQCASGLCLGGYCASGQPAGGPCTSGADCASGVCQSNACVGSGQGAPSGSACTTNAQCASGTCANGTCSTGTGLPNGASCSSNNECSSGACVNGICGVVVTQQPNGSPCNASTDCASGLCVSNVCTSPTVGPGGTPTTTGPQFGGTGSGFRPLTAGCGPNTADQCTGTCEQAGGDPNVSIIRPPATLCFYSPDDPTPNDPAVVIEQSIETLNGVTYIHIRITFDPSFTDNVYGTDSNRADSGWHMRGGPTHIYGHTFNPDLQKSDHTEIMLTDATGATVLNFHVDYISADPSEPCGYGSLGVTGGDGTVISGDPTKILAVTTSLERNLNGCGYCTSTACATSGNCVIDSPTTDANFSANPATPNWDYRNVYEMWIDATAFGSAGFGQAFMTYVHASPNKSTLVSLNVTPKPCPPTWDKPYCPPSVIQEGGNCFGSPPGGGGAGGAGNGGAGNGGTGNGGTAGAAGNGGYGGGTVTPCPVNWQIYISTEGKSSCTPIPFANYPGMTPCPAGYTLDLASEGRYCLPTP